MTAYARTIGAFPLERASCVAKGNAATHVRSFSDALYPVHHCVREHVQIRANEEILP